MSADPRKTSPAPTHCDGSGHDHTTEANPSGRRVEELRALADRYVAAFNTLGNPHPTCVVLLFVRQMEDAPACRDVALEMRTAGLSNEGVAAVLQSAWQRAEATIPPLEGKRCVFCGENATGTLGVIHKSRPAVNFTEPREVCEPCGALAVARLDSIWPASKGGDA